MKTYKEYAALPEGTKVELCIGDEVWKGTIVKAWEPSKYGSYKATKFLEDGKNRPISTHFSAIRLAK